MDIKKAIYIKLGEGGLWEKDCIENGKIRFSWRLIPTPLLNEKRWDEVKTLIDKDYQERGKKTGATNDLNALRMICEANEETVILTFHARKMYWCVPNFGIVYEDEVSKYRRLTMAWSPVGIGSCRVFGVNQISGRLTKYQGFMGTACSVRELDYLNSIINGQDSVEYSALIQAEKQMVETLVPAIKNLTAKDFEILVDLIFRNVGWKRTSVLGEEMKFFDLVLEEPLGRHLHGAKRIHGVQIKAECSFETFKKYREEFFSTYQADFDDLYFFVHSPDRTLANHVEDDDSIQLLRVEEVAELALEHGLATWIKERCR